MFYKAISLFHLLLIFTMISCENKTECKYIDMSYYIINIQKINSVINKGFFLKQDFNTDCCCYEIELPISSDKPNTLELSVIIEKQGTLIYLNNILYFTYHYTSNEETDTVVFLDFNLKEGENRKVLFKESQFIIYGDKTSRKESLITLEKVFYSEEYNEEIYKFRLDNYLLNYGMSFIVFISKESGIRGNYYSFHSNNTFFKVPEGITESILQTSIQGDIFEKYFDYSKTRFVSLM